MFSRKGAKTQREHTEIAIFLGAFAPLRELSFSNATFKGERYVH
jgi:hypothetical protein